MPIKIETKMIIARGKNQPFHFSLFRQIGFQDCQVSNNLCILPIFIGNAIGLIQLHIFNSY
jgi:hypothetical protein